MLGSILQFSVCPELVLRRKDIIAFLHRSLPEVRVISIDLDDKLFTMSVQVSQYRSRLIEDAIAEKGLFIKLLQIKESNY